MALPDTSGGKRRTNYFETSFIDRTPEGWRDDGWLTARLDAPTSRFVPVWRSRNLFIEGGSLEPVWLSPADAGELLRAAESLTLLGVSDGQTYFAIGLPTGGDSSPAGLVEQGRFQDLRLVAPQLDPRDSAILAYARAMAYWHSRHRYCGDCGRPTESTEGGHMRVCTDEQCGQRHFPRTDPAIIVLVTSEERCLLGRKAEWPESRYSTIAGFVEPGESLEDAVAREVREETGILLGEIHYHSSQPWPFPSSLMLGFIAQAASTPIRIDGDELEHARWFTRDEMRSEIMAGTLRLSTRIAISHHLIQSWFDAGNFGPLEAIEDAVGART